MSDPKYLYWARQASKDPQAHIDALVEAGVLKRWDKSWCTASGDLVACYTVDQPHKHDWRVALDSEGGHVSTVVKVICHGCHESEHVPNRLPILVPE